MKRGLFRERVSIIIIAVIILAILFVLIVSYSSYKKSEVSGEKGELAESPPFSGSGGIQSTCGNGVCEPGEDTLNCGPDCAGGISGECPPGSDGNICFGDNGQPEFVCNGDKAETYLERCQNGVCVMSNTPDHVIDCPNCRISGNEPYGFICNQVAAGV